ncbi:23S rRNA (uridine(2552)-2'-O)-methyltransferase [Salinarchaeum laminariae]|uniref:23S rRNA (uridine(2552)-2'-O)-methyltransferase n=1 Tax=Salinarchaeum laminariae TaxID=869888 RepID=UPI0020BDA1E5|nr:23S rRNA (uridine(2552)-2'-O)-methyltransferase [Salinarchaeum laminariae]
MTGKDEYYNRAKVEGYRARSAFKLKQLDEAAGLFGPGNVVVDLGAAPGGWLQVAAERVGPDGTVIGVDRQRIDDLEDPEPRVELLRGDITEDDTREHIREIAATVTGSDAAAAETENTTGAVDVVLSDMAPNVSGQYELDHARSVHLARQAFETAKTVLGPGGDFAAKVFQGQDLEAFKADVDDAFEYARTVVPDATRDSSSEVYIVGKHRLTAPVEAGEELTVDVVDEGSEGDGVAHVEGFTVFVSDASVGETVPIRIDEVKPRFAFAERTD